MRYPGRNRSAILQAIEGGRCLVTDDPALSTAFVRVSGLVDPPPKLMRPDRVARVLLHGLRSRRTQAVTTGEGPVKIW